MKDGKNVNGEMGVIGLTAGGFTKGDNNGFTDVEVQTGREAVCLRSSEIARGVFVRGGLYELELRKGKGMVC